MPTYLSKRLLQLVYHLPPLVTPIITVENYMKWYDLYVVMPNGNVEVLDERNLYHQIQSEFPSTTLVGDHVWNPSYVLELAKRLDFEVCQESLEMITGRWVIEHQDNTELAFPLSERKDLK